jgi:SAM-dependent methyltransferase
MTELPRTSDWNDAAGDYEAFAEPFTRQFAEQGLALAGGVAPGIALLDVAAGTGALALLAARAGARVTAVDFAPAMVARLAPKLAPFPGCEARVMDGQQLDFGASRFDLVGSNFGVMLFPDPLQGLSEMARVLRPGGRALVTSWTSEHGAGPAPLLVQALHRLFPDRPHPDWPPGLARWRDAEALAADMRRAGLAEVKIMAISGSWGAPSAAWIADMAHRLFGQFPMWQALTGDEQLAVRRALREALEAEHPGEVRMHSSATLAIGVRG